ncbi:hypothetical protein ACSMXN_05665 [Jatrophihabitans sp. DSM 45814]
MTLGHYEISVAGQIDTAIIGAPWIDSVEGTQAVTHFVTSSIESGLLYELLDHLAANSVDVIRLHRL